MDSGASQSVDWMAKQTHAGRVGGWHGDASLRFSDGGAAAPLTNQAAESARLEAPRTVTHRRFYCTASKITASFGASESELNTVGSGRSTEDRRTSHFPSTLICPGREKKLSAINMR